jgi:hypothetical protein
MLISLDELATTNTTGSFRYEERNDGYDGISFTLDGAAADGNNEEPETKGLPQCVAIPLRQVNTRAGRPFPFLSMSDITMCNVSQQSHSCVNILTEISTKFGMLLALIPTCNVEKIWILCGL